MILQVYVVFYLVAIDLLTCLAGQWPTKEQLDNSRSIFRNFGIWREGSNMRFRCWIPFSCLKQPITDIKQGYATCTPAVWVTTGRLAHRVRLARLIVNELTDDTSEILTNPNARFAFSVNATWLHNSEQKMIQFDVEIQNFSTREAGVYYCLDGDAATLTTEGIYEAQVFFSSELYAFDTLVSQHGQNTSISAVAFKPGFTSNITCHYKGTPSEHLFDFYIKCPGDFDFSTFSHFEKVHHVESTIFNATIGYHYKITRSSVAFIMTKEIDGCEIMCSLAEFVNVHTSQLVGKGKKRQGILNNSVLVQTDYTPLSDIRFIKNKKVVWHLILITFVSMSVCVMLLCSAAHIYRKKTLFFQTYSKSFQDTTDYKAKKGDRPSKSQSNIAIGLSLPSSEGTPDCKAKKSHSHSRGQLNTAIGLSPPPNEGDSESMQSFQDCVSPESEKLKLLKWHDD